MKCLKQLMIVWSLILAASLAGGCATKTEFGSCKGLVTKAEKDPKLKYEVSTRNVVLAVLFSSTLLWPAATASFWIWCPTSRTGQ